MAIEVSMLKIKLKVSMYYSSKLRGLVMTFKFKKA